MRITPTPTPTPTHTHPHTGILSPSAMGEGEVDVSDHPCVDREVPRAPKVAESCRVPPVPVKLPVANVCVCVCVREREFDEHAEVDVQDIKKFTYPRSRCIHTFVYVRND